MKKILSLVAVLGAAVTLHAQGTFDPNTGDGDSAFGAHTSGTVYDQANGGIKAVGVAYQGQFYIGPSGTTDPNALVAVGPQGKFGGSSQASLGAGYFVGDNTGTVTTGFNPGTTVVVQLRAWNASTGTTYANATVHGQSTLMTIALGGVGSPPSVPTILPMANFNLTAVAPEPATIALGLMGAGALFIRRRKV